MGTIGRQAVQAGDWRKIHRFHAGDGQLPFGESFQDENALDIRALV